MPASAALQEALQSGDRDAIRRALRPRVRTSDNGILVLQTKGIGPVELGLLEELMTGEALEVVFSRPRSAKVLAERNGGERHVVTVTDELADALARATPEELVDLATPWSRTDSFTERDDPEVLGHFLVALGELARRAGERGERLYCWICL